MLLLIYVFGEMKPKKIKNVKMYGVTLLADFIQISIEYDNDETEYLNFKYDELSAIKTFDNELSKA